MNNSEENKKSVFAVLSAINCNGHSEKKNGLTYLSWAWAWHMVKSYYPEATYTIYESPECNNYHTDGRTCWVKTGVTIEGIEHIEYLPVMDHRNASIPVERVTSFDVNKAIQRSLTKACARHGLGLYIYAGEDLPDKADEERREQTMKQRKMTPAKYQQFVVAAAQGKPCKDGRSVREHFIEEYAGNDAAALQAFDQAVVDYVAKGPELFQA